MTDSNFKSISKQSRTLVWMYFVFITLTIGASYTRLILELEIIYLYLAVTIVFSSYPIISLILCLFKEKAKKRMRLFTDSVYAFIPVLLAAFIFHFRAVTLGIDLFVVPTESMVPTIMPNDIVIADLRFKPEELKAGDIIVFNIPTTGAANFIKRIDSFPKPTYVRVLGDNVMKSFDSRIFGNVPINSIKAKAYFKIRDSIIVRINQ